MGFGKDGRGQILYDNIATVNLSGLAGQDVVELGSLYNDTLVEDFRIMKCDYWMGILPAQAVVLLNGPILIGLAAGFLSAAAIEEALESLPLSADTTAIEDANRPVWPLEVFMIPDVDEADNATLWRKGTFNPRWTFGNGSPGGWTWWAYNFSNAAIVTGTNISIFAKMFGMWVK